MRARRATLIAALTTTVAVSATTLTSFTSAAHARDDEPETDFEGPTITVTRPATDSDWYDGDTDYTVTVSDEGSGVATVEYSLTGATKAEGALGRSGGTVTATGEGATYLSVTASDNAGNETWSTSHRVQIDRTAPVASITSAIDGKSFAKGSEVRLDYSCADEHSGVKSCTGPVASGGLLDTSTVGDHTVTVTAIDQVGRRHDVSASYSVHPVFETQGEATFQAAPRVGAPTRVVLPAISPEPAAVAFQWFVGDEAVAGASGDTFTPAGGDAGRPLRAEVTVTKPGYEPLTLTVASQQIQPGTLQPSGDVAVQGRPVAGQVLTARTPTFPAGSQVSLQWLADGKPVPGADGARLRLDPALVGRAVSLRATATRPGYTTWTGTSAATAPVARAAAVLQAGAKVTGSRPKRTVQLSVKVRADGLVPTGQITVTRSGKVVGRGVVDRQGKAVIKLRPQAPGTVRYVVRYAGDAATQQATRTLTVRVRPATRGR